MSTTTCHFCKTTIKIAVGAKETYVFPLKTILNFPLNSYASIPLKYTVMKQKYMSCIWSHKTFKVKDPAEY